jgi:hypothetical protein
MDPVIAATLRGTLALLLATAAAHKVAAPGRFRRVLAEYRLVPVTVVPAVALAVVAAEVTVAAALLATGGPLGPLGAAALLLVYGGAIGANLLRGRRDIDCGCGRYGRDGTRLSGFLVLRNAALAAAALALLAPVRPRGLVWVDAVSVVGGTLALAALWAAADRLLTSAPALARPDGDA